MSLLHFYLFVSLYLQYTDVLDFCAVVDFKFVALVVTLVKTEFYLVDNFRCHYLRSWDQVKTMESELVWLFFFVLFTLVGRRKLREFFLN